MNKATRANLEMIKIRPTSMTIEKLQFLKWHYLLTCAIKGEYIKVTHHTEFMLSSIPQVCLFFHLPISSWLRSTSKFLIRSLKLPFLQMAW